MPMVSMTVNGRPVSAEVEGRTLLVQFLREPAQLTGTHVGCDTTPVRLLHGAPERQGREVLHRARRGLRRRERHDDRRARARRRRCTRCRKRFASTTACNAASARPGMIMTAVDIVNRHGHDLDPHTIREQLDGNICRCTGYHNIVKAIQAGAAAMKGPPGKRGLPPGSESHEFPPASSTRIGEPVRRREDLRLITGKGRFSDDVNLPGQAYMAVVRSPHAHARILSIDTAARAACPGVLAVLTGQDMLADGLKPFPHKPFTAHPADIKLENTDGSPLFSAPQYALAIDKVRHVGEAIAIVIAETVAAAQGRRGARGRRLRSAARRHRHRRGGAAGRAARVGRRALQRLPRRGGRQRPRSHRGRVRARGARREVRNLDTARHRRPHGAARRGGRVRSGDAALHAPRRQRRRAAAQERPRDHARRRGEQTCACSCTTSAATSARAA